MYESTKTKLKRVKYPMLMSKTDMTHTTMYKVIFTINATQLAKPFLLLLLGLQFRKNFSLQNRLLKQLQGAYRAIIPDRHRTRTGKNKNMKNSAIYLKNGFTFLLKLTFPIISQMNPPNWPL